jgi:hypothetical protein
MTNDKLQVLRISVYLIFGGLLLVKVFDIWSLDFI